MKKRGGVEAKNSRNRLSVDHMLSLNGSSRTHFNTWPQDSRFWEYFTKTTLKNFIIINYKGSRFFICVHDYKSTQTSEKVP